MPRTLEHYDRALDEAISKLKDVKEISEKDVEEVLTFIIQAAIPIKTTSTSGNIIFIIQAAIPIKTTSTSG